MRRNLGNSLKNTKGLNFLTFLDERHKKLIRSSEEENNLGVFEAIKRNYTALLSHDSSFRNPSGEIVVKKGDSVIFPPVSFPEIKARNVVSSSPSLKVHRELLNRLNLSLKPEEATLIVGFDVLKN